MWVATVLGRSDECMRRRTCQSCKAVSSKKLLPVPFQKQVAFAMYISCCTRFCSFGLVNRAHSFGHEGHEAVAILALQKLQADEEANNPKATAALQHITAILSNDDIAAA